MFKLSPLRKRKIKRAVRRFKRKVKRFWNEWGISKQDFFNLITLLAMFTSLFSLYTVLALFYQ